MNEPPIAIAPKTKEQVPGAIRMIALRPRDSKKRMRASTQADSDGLAAKSSWVLKGDGDTPDVRV